MRGVILLVGFLTRVVGAVACLLCIIEAHAQVSACSSTLNWKPPVDYVDGTPIKAGELVGYHAYWGTTSTALVNAASITSATATSFVVDDLPNGPNYFVVTAITSKGGESAYSKVATKTFTGCTASGNPGPGKPSFSIVTSYGTTPVLTISALIPAKYVVRAAAVGGPIYADRDYVWVGLGPLAGSTAIQTANDDKQSTVVPSFTISQAAVVYVALDARLTTPAWLSTWTLVGTINGSEDPPGRRLYSRNYGPGAVVLGANGATSSASSMYSVFVR